MTRIYAAPIIGSGRSYKVAGEDVDDPYRAALTDLMAAEGDRVNANIASVLAGPDRGKPLRPWTLCFATLADWSGVTPDMTLLADLDDPNALQRSVSADMRNKLQSIGVRPDILPGPPDVEAMVRALFAEHYTHVPADRWLLWALGLPDVAGGGFLEDTFTDTDGVRLQEHDPNIGDVGSWEAMDFNAVGTGGSSFNSEINTNRCRSAVGFEFSRGYRNSTDPGANEYDVECDFTTGTKGSRSYFACHGRMTPTGTSSSAVDRYIGFYRFLSSSQSWQLRKVVSGSLTNLDSFTEDIGTGTFTMKLELRDAAKKVFEGVTEKVTSADDEITQNGRAGMALPAHESNTNYMDNLVVTVPGAVGVTTGDMALTGQGDLDPVGQLTAVGAAALTGQGDLDPVGHAIVLGDVPLSGQGDLDPVGTLVFVGDVALTGQGDLDPVGSLIALGALSLTGQGLLEFSGEIISVGVTTGTVQLTGQGDLDPVGTLIAAGVLPLSGQGDLSATGLEIMLGVLPLSGQGDLDPVGSLVAFGVLPLSGQGALDFVGELVGEWLPFGQVVRLINVQGDKEYRLAVVLKSLDGVNPAEARLFNITDGMEVVGSGVQSTSTTPELVVGSVLTLTGNKLYRVQTKGSA